jgi:Universal stress protein family
MQDAERLLLAVTASEGSDRAARYVATILSGRSGFEVHLLHILREIPPDMPQFAPSGAAGNNPGEEEVAQQWERVATGAAQPVFDRVRKVLTQSGVPDDAIRTHCYYAFDTKSIAEHVLRTARAHRCGTVVVGRTVSTWYADLFYEHTSADIVKQGQGLAVWVVE